MVGAFSSGDSLTLTLSHGMGWDEMAPWQIPAHHKTLSRLPTDRVWIMSTLCFSLSLSLSLSLCHPPTSFFSHYLSPSLSLSLCLVFSLSDLISRSCCLPSHSISVSRLLSRSSLSPDNCFFSLSLTSHSFFSHGLLYPPSLFLSLFPVFLFPLSVLYSLFLFLFLMVLPPHPPLSFSFFPGSSL